MVAKFFGRALACARLGILPGTWLVLFALLILPFGQAFAEGSRDLHPASATDTNTGRGVMNLATGTTYFPGGVVSARQFLYVYVQKDEYILLGSRNRTANNTGQIYVFSPTNFGPKGNETPPAVGSAAYTCNGAGTSPNIPGLIVNRAAELAGPKSADNTQNGGNANRYQPCAYKAPSSGVYGVLFSGGTSSTNNDSIDPPQTLNTAVSAWDVTVRSSDPTSLTDLDGRVFTYAWTVDTGANNTTTTLANRQYRIATTLYYVSLDGYRYQQDFRGVDPRQAAFYANRSGFLDTNGAALYHDFRGSSQTVTGGASAAAGITAQAPQYPIFFSNVSPTGPNAAEVNRVLTALSIAAAPQTPVLTNPTFVGNVGGNTSTVSAGGAFTFDTLNTLTYQIVISRDGSDFDPANPLNRVLTGTAITGSHTVLWDGKDNNGTSFPAGSYTYQIVGRNGEIHFPIADIEGNVNGGPTLTKLNGAHPGDTTVSFDDRGYMAANGTVIGTLNGKLCGGMAGANQVEPTPTYSLVGVDSAAFTGTGVNALYYRRWNSPDPTQTTGANNANPGTDCSNNNQFFGDAKGLDIWALEKSQVFTPPIVIVPPLTGVDVGTQVSVTSVVQAGDSAYGTFVFTNAGNANATGVAYQVKLGTPSTPTTCPAAVSFTMVPTGVTATYNPAPACTITFTGMPTTLTPGQTLTFNFNYVVAPTNPGPIPITTIISAANETPGAPAPNTATAQTIVAKPIITVVKTSTPASNTPVNIGDTITYTLSADVANAPLTATLTLADALGTGLTFGSVTSASPAFTCSGSLTCTLPNGAAIGTYTVTYTATVAASAVGSVGNNVTANGGGGATPTCNTCSTTHPIPVPKLTILKTVSASPLIVGQTASYTLKVTNTGATATTAVSTITDVIPTGLTLGTMPSGCTASGQTVTCTIAAGLATGAANAVSFIIPVTPTAAAGASATNTASVIGGGDPGCVIATDCPSSVTTPIDAPKLTLLKSASAANFVVGQAASYTLKVTNTGTTATTAAATITDVIPTGLTLGTMPTGCAKAGQTVTCTIAAGLATGAANAVSFIIPVTPTAAAGASATNTASVIGGGDPGCAIATDCPSSVTTPIDAPKLTILKTASAASFVVGQAASYTLKVTNTGTTATTAAATITDVIPTGLTLGTLPAGCTNLLQAVTCTIPAGLATGAANAVSFIIPVTPTAAAGASATNTANVIGGGDPGCAIATDCPSSVTTPIDAPKLTILKSASAANFVVGQAASYTLKVTNTGTIATNAVATVTDVIPTGLTLGTLPAGCAKAGQTVTCTIAAGLATGAANAVSFIIPVTPTAAAGASATNTASVIGGGDPGCAIATDCPSSVTTPIDAPKLTILKTASAASFVVGQAASYTLKVTNTGTTATTAVSTITDVIPTGLTLGTLPAGCTNLLQAVTCTIPAGLATGAANAVSFIIPVTPTAAAGASATNTANVIGGGDPGCAIATDCPSSVTTPIDAPKLTILKSASAARFVVGQAASYTLKVTNTGTIATNAVATVTDVIPTGLTIGTLPSGCTASGQTVTCTIAAGLATGAANAVSFIIPVTPTAAAGPSVANSANVIGGGDPGCVVATDCPSSVTTPIDAPMLAILKTASAANFVVGQAASYTLKVTNTGTTATNAVATVTDVIPTGLTLGTIPSGCTASGQTVTCTIAAGLATGAANAVSFIIPVMPTAAAGASATNSANVIGGGDPGCAIATDCPSSVTTPIDAPKLTLLKSASAASFVVGQAASYTLKVTNTGTIATNAVATVTDVIPTGLTLGTLPSGCTASGQTVTCTIAAGLATGAANAVSFIIPVTPTAAAGASATNTASVIGGGDPGCAIATDCPSSVTTPIDAPKLTILKSASAANFVVGQAASYTLKVTNTGTTATNAVATVTDVIPTGLTLGTIPSGCTASGQTVTCTIAAGLATGAANAVSFIIPVMPTAAAGASATNSANVIGGGDPGCAIATDCPSSVTTPIDAPKLTILKSASAANFVVGQAASYTLKVTNTGTTATNAVATVTDVIPTGLTLGTLPSGCTASGQTVTCTIAAGLATGAANAVSFIIPVTPTAAAGASATNTASVIGGGDPGCAIATDCPSSVTTPIDAPKLTILKTASAASFVVGQAASYTLKVTNTGTTATTAAATITDVIPTGLTIGTLPGSCSATGQAVTCTIASGLATGAANAVSFIIPVTPTAVAGPSVTNSASVVGGGDPACAIATDCPSSVTTPIDAPKLTILKTASPSPFIVGQAASYTLKVTNTGTIATTAVSAITDVIPTGLTLGVMPARCTNVLQTVTCTIPAGLATGAANAVTFIVPVTPTAAAASPVTNTASVIGGGDPACVAVGDCDSTVITPMAANVSIAKALTAESGTVAGVAEPGENLTYTITLTNTGGVDATGYGLSDALPANTTFVSATDLGTVTTGVINWTGLTVPKQVGATAGTKTVTVVVKVASPIPSGVTSIANVAYKTGTTPPSCPDAACVVTPTSGTVTIAKALTAESGTIAGVAEPGENLTYTITLTNSGGADVTGYGLSDAVPANTTFVSATDLGTVTTGVINWTGLTVPKQIGATAGTKSVTVIVKVANPIPSGVTSIANVAYKTGTTPPTCPDPACVTTPTAGTVTIAKALTAESGTVAGVAEPGENLTYTITLTNTGGVDATGYGLSDALPANTTFVSATDLGTVTTGVINWTGLTVPKQVGATAGTKTVTVVVKVASPIPSGVTSIANVAYKTGTTPPTCPDAACVITPTSGTVTIAKALTGESGTVAGVAEPGENLTYTITLTNTGGVDATGYGLSDALPANTTFVSATDLGTVTTGVINWTGLTVPKQVGATAGTKTVTVVVKVASPIPSGVTSIANVAYKTGTTPPTCPDAACVITPTSGTVTIAKALTGESGTVAGVAEPGENLTYTITLTNTGGVDATGYGLSDALPANTTFVSATDLGTVTTGVINWTGLTVPKQVGATAGTKTVTVVVKVASPIPSGVTSIANVAYKTGTTPPSCPDPACVTTPTSGTVTIVKTLTGESGNVPGVAEPGETLTYSIKLSNSGGSDVTGYGVTDNLDLHTIYVSSTNAGSYSAGKVTWTGLVVPAGGSLTLTVVVTVDSVIPAGVTQIVNLVYQTGTTPPTCPPAGPQCVVTPTAGKVTIVKALSGESGSVAGVAEPGEQLTYTITLSNGGGTAVTGYGVTDKLDANTTFVSADNSGANAAGIVTWSNLTVPANNNLVLTVIVKVINPIPVGVTRIANLAYQTGTTPPPCTTSGPQCVITPTASNISVTKALSGESITADGIAEPGELLTYTITVRNDGGTATTNTIVNETVPLHTTFVSGTPAWTCAVDSPGGTACNTLVNVPAHDGTQPGVTTVLFTVKVADPLPVGVTSIANAVALNDGTPPDCVALPSQPGCVVVSTGNVSLAKTVTAVTPTGPSSYVVSYLIEVSNVGGSAATYTLTDTLGFPAQGVLFTGNASVTTVGGTLNPALAGGQFSPANGVVVQLSANNISVAAGAIHRYTVKVPVGVQPAALQGGTCTGAAGNGFYNAAELSGSFTLQSAACAPISGDIALIHLVKTVTLGQDFNGNHYGDVGDVLDYTFTISNPGTVPLTTVQLFDPRVASLQCDPITATGMPIVVLRGDELFSSAFESVVIPGTLIPGDSVECRATWALTANDVARRQVVNSATATATGPAGQAVTSTATAIYTSFR